MSVQCPKCGSSAIVSNGRVPRKGGKVHTSRCNDCGHICTDDKLLQNVHGHVFIKEPIKPGKPITEAPKSGKLIDKGHKL